MDWQDVSGRVLSTATVSIVGFTVVLTAALIGLVALTSGEVTGVGDRAQWYVLTLALFFLLTLWQLDDRESDGLVVLVAAGGVASLGAVVVGLATEGVVVAMEEPEAVVGSDLFVYVVAAGMICTGLAIWVVRHWRELAAS